MGEGTGDKLLYIDEKIEFLSMDSRESIDNSCKTEVNLMKPNMLPEILECLHFYFEDNPELEVDCLLYLTELRDNWSRTAELSDEAFTKLQEMGRCPYCGELMQIHHYKEPHPELDGCPMEDMTELYCPNCDIGGVYY